MFNWSQKANERERERDMSKKEKQRGVNESIRYTYECYNVWYITRKKMPKERLTTIDDDEIGLHACKL